MKQRTSSDTRIIGTVVLALAFAVMGAGDINNGHGVVGGLMLAFAVLLAMFVPG